MGKQWPLTLWLEQIGYYGTKLIVIAQYFTTFPLWYVAFCVWKILTFCFILLDEHEERGKQSLFFLFFCYRKFKNCLCTLLRVGRNKVCFKKTSSGFLFFSGVLLGFIGLLGCILLCCILIVANTVLDLLMNVPRVALLFPIGCRHLGNICSLLSYWLKDFSQPFGSSGVIWKVFHVRYMYRTRSNPACNPSKRSQ
jgi:hypothetical protein